MNPNENQTTDTPSRACELLEMRRLAVQVREEFRRRLAEAVSLRRGGIRVHPN